jgi:hypothetical protein
VALLGSEPTITCTHPSIKPGDPPIKVEVIETAQKVEELLPKPQVEIRKLLTK